MAAQVAEERFDWRGPAVAKPRGSILRKLIQIVVPPKGHKVLPTGSGFLLIFIGLTIGLAAYNTVNNVLFAALALLIAALILSGVVCWGNLLCARWRLETSSTFRVGEEGVATVVVENARRRFPLFSLFFSLESAAADDEKRLYLKERLDPGETTSLTWRFKPERRIKTKVRIEHVVSNFPFGFLSKHLPGECEATITVWPRRIAYSSFRNQGLAGALQGRSSKRKGNSGELIGLRQYQKGDAIRSIHWKVSAKQGRLTVKQNASETQSLFSLVIDPASFLWPDAESFERMCSFAASLAEDLFLESKLDQCSVVGADSLKIQRVSDLEAFFDVLSELSPAERSETPQEAGRSNRIVFLPTQKGGVGAFINDVQIAQA